MQITLEDCMCMVELIKSHQSWNNHTDWCVGSPSYGLVKYVLPDQGVHIIRGDLFEHPDLLVLGPKTKYLSITHAHFMLEARWRTWFKSWEELHACSKLDPHTYYDVCWVGDPLMFFDWLTEFKLWNSLTAQPEIY